MLSLYGGSFVCCLYHKRSLFATALRALRLTHVMPPPQHLANNNALGSWRSSLDVKYAFGTSVREGHLFSNFKVIALAQSGAGATFSWASSATINGSFLAIDQNNVLRGVSCFESGILDYSEFTLVNDLGHYLPLSNPSWVYQY